MTQLSTQVYTLTTPMSSMHHHKYIIPNGSYKNQVVCFSGGVRVLMLHFFADGFPPDGTPITVAQSHHTTLVIVYYILAVCGIIVSLVFLIFNIVYRNKK